MGDYVPPTVRVHTEDSEPDKGVSKPPSTKGIGCYMSSCDSPNLFAVSLKCFAYPATPCPARGRKKHKTNQLKDEQAANVRHRPWCILLLCVSSCLYCTVTCFCISLSQMQTKGTIWNAMMEADFDLVKKLVLEDPRVLEEEGPVGDKPVHLLFLLGGPPPSK